MSPGDLLARRLLFVTGKGGVGKTTVAAALARLGAERGLRVLVCEMDAKGALADAFELPSLEFAAREVEPGLFAMAMNTEDSLREYLRIFVRLPLITKLGPLARTFDFVADAAPGVKEILAVGKLCHEVRQRTYHLVVVDAEATGHVISQIDAPRAIQELVQVGLIRDQTAWMIDLLEDPATTGVVVVTTPEEMPVVESIELIETLRSTTRVDVAALIANRVLPEPFAGNEERLFETLAEQGSPAHDRLTEVAGAAVDQVLGAARLAARLRRTGADHLATLRAAVPDVELILVPELYARSGGRRTVELVATALGEEF
ncbi:MAG: ArsA family ATPase [Ilumatobacteraceae bacterium]